MRAPYVLSLGLLLPVATACAQGDTGNLAGAGGAAAGSTSGGQGGTNGGTGGATTSTSSGATTSTSSTSGGIPTTCAGAHGSVGCCNDDVAYYCESGKSSPTVSNCTGSKVCGWNATDDYYACVSSPGGPDPSGSNPEACN